jgi:hypothetical protein
MRQTELNVVGDGLAHAFKHYKNFWGQEPTEVEVVYYDPAYEVRLRFLDPMDPITFHVAPDDG